MTRKKRDFRELWDGVQASDRHVCVGLDSEWGKIPATVKSDPELMSISTCWEQLSGLVVAGGVDIDPGMRAFVAEHLRAFANRARTTEAVVFFNAGIVSETCDIAHIYKPNLAFYLAMGTPGISALRRTVQMINSEVPEAVVILDAKWADIGNTNLRYVEFLDYIGADAITLHPYLGGKALLPFLDRADKGCFILCRTSNPESSELQGLEVGKQELFFMRVASRVNAWNVNGNCGLVAGATNPADIRCIRQVFQGPLLIPGVGAQGGDLEAAVIASLLSDGTMNAAINSSSGIIFAKEGSRAATLALHQSIGLALAA